MITRETARKFAIGLSSIFLADAVFMTWTLFGRGFAGMAYVPFGLLLLFLPATLGGLALTVLYLRGISRLSWELGRTGMLFLVVFFLAIAFKVAVWVVGDQ